MFIWVLESWNYTHRLFTTLWLFIKFARISNGSRGLVLQFQTPMAMFNTHITFLFQLLKKWWFFSICSTKAISNFLHNLDEFTRVSYVSMYGWIQYFDEDVLKDLNITKKLYVVHDFICLPKKLSINLGGFQIYPVLYDNWLFLTLFLFPSKKETRRNSRTGFNSWGFLWEVDIV